MGACAFNFVNVFISVCRSFIASIHPSRKLVQILIG